MLHCSHATPPRQGCLYFAFGDRRCRSLTAEVLAAASVTVQGTREAGWRAVFSQTAELLTSQGERVDWREGFIIRGAGTTVRGQRLGTWIVNPVISFQKHRAEGVRRRVGLALLFRLISLLFAPGEVRGVGSCGHSWGVEVGTQRTGPALL